MSAGRVVSCAKCGAQAPELAEDQRSFVCTYCKTQTFVDAPEKEKEPASADDPERVRPLPRARRPPRWIGLVVVLAIGIAMVLVIRRAQRGPAAELEDCKTFSGDAMHATWERCPSKATRSIVCHATFGAMPGMPPGAMPDGFDSLTCDCLRDGTKTWFFDAKTAPPLASRADAERVAEASCKMW